MPRNDFAIETTLALLSLSLVGCAVGVNPDDLYGETTLSSSNSSTTTDSGSGTCIDECSGGTDDGPTTNGSSPEPGEHPAVDEARALFPKYLDIHANIIQRTCTPNEGVCHNNKEYPDLRTAASMQSIVRAPCNEDVEDPLRVFNGCEPAGDRLELAFEPGESVRVTIAYADAPGGDALIDIYLREPLPDDLLPGDDIRIVRGDDLTIAELETSVPITAGSTALALTSANKPSAELASDIVVGDPNRDGVFGADDPFTLVEPGLPERSYLLQRLLGAVPGSPMPLANTPLSAPEIIAISCWIEALEGAENDSNIKIDYDECFTAESFGVQDPESGRALSVDVQPIFTAHCVDCHNGSQSNDVDLDLRNGYAYESLMRLSEEDPEHWLVEPGVPTSSYLITKLTSDGKTGVQMPIDDELTDQEIHTIRAWIIAGAPND